MTKYYIILIFMTIIGSIASLFLKEASNSETIMKLLKNKSIYIGGFLYLLSAVLNIYVLKYLDYSAVLPLTSITYIWTLIISYKVLKEKISLKKIIGVCCILIGAVIIVL